MVLAVTTLSRGYTLSERTDDVPNRISDLPRCMGLCVSRTSRSTVDMGLNAGSRTTNFFRSAVKLITMRSPVGAVSNVLHDIPQRIGELGVLYEHGADRAEEYGDVTSKSRRERVELRKRRVWGIVGGRGVGRRDFLDIDGCIGGGGGFVAKNTVDVNRMFLRSVVGEDGSGRRGGVGLASFALISQCRCDSPGMCGGRIPGHAGVKGRVSTDWCKLDLVPRSGTNFTTVEGVESRNPLPIVLDDILVERDGSKSVVRGGLAEPVRDRRSVRERLIFEAPDDVEVYDREASKWRV
jgi:hypothetical protein